MKNDLLEFFRAVESRLSVTEARYRGAGFGYQDDRVVSELEEELLDLPGWSFLRWARLRGATSFDPVLLLEFFHAIDRSLEGKDPDTLDDLDGELVALAANAVLAWVRLRRCARRM